MSSNDDITRRDFVTMTVAGIAVAAVDASAQGSVSEKTVEIKTPDGTFVAFDPLREVIR
jgi:hypothetical protein